MFIYVITPHYSLKVKVEIKKKRSFANNNLIIILAAMHHTPHQYALYIILDSFLRDDYSMEYSSKQLMC